MPGLDLWKCCCVQLLCARARASTKKICAVYMCMQVFNSNGAFNAGSDIVPWPVGPSTLMCMPSRVVVRCGCLVLRCDKLIAAFRLRACNYSIGVLYAYNYHLEIGGRPYTVFDGVCHSCILILMRALVYRSHFRGRVLRSETKNYCNCRVFFSNPHQ